MIINTVGITNFGVYRKQIFNLAPVSVDGFQKPIVLFTGKNGVGKTSFVEAIRLCLHGSLAFGDRVSRAEYENYLRKRLHASSTVTTDKALLSVNFNYVTEGKRRQYNVERSWHLKDNRIVEHLDIREDGQLLPHVTDDQKEAFLRDLISPSVTKLFFFDGEKLEQLADDDTSRTLLGETINNLLGLNLVNQLNLDLDVFISRQVSGLPETELHDKFERLKGNLTQFAVTQEKLDLKHEKLRNEFLQREQAVNIQEQKIAAEGGEFAVRAAQLKQQKEHLLVEVEVKRRQLQELCGGLLPFGISSLVNQRLSDRLIQEELFERGQAAQSLLTDQLDKLQTYFSSEEFWQETDVKVTEAKRRSLFGKIEQSLRQTIPAANINEDEVIHHVSGRNRSLLQMWISTSLEETPNAFREVVTHLGELELKLETIDEQLKLVPDDITLRPLVETLKNLEEKLEEARAAETKCAEDKGKIRYDIEQTELAWTRLKEEIEVSQATDSRVSLAMRTKRALEEYRVQLAREKISALERALLARFNELCRKENLTDRIQINADTFEITLYRGERRFDRTQLSAGEKQVLAIATIWALREVSGRPMPVIVDTPLGRLDSDHRLSMLQNYFPRASHQVLLLATDTEMDEGQMQMIAPAVARSYILEFDNADGATHARELSLNKSVEGMMA